MLNTVLVQFEDSSKNYKTNVNGKSTFQDLNDYFVGNTFFMGTCDTQESDPKYWHKCIAIKLFKGV